MPVKKVPNTINIAVAVQDEILNLFTTSKKAHFEISEAKLYDAIVTSTHTPHRYFNAYLSTYPFVAVHVTGMADLLNEHKEWLVAQVTSTLKQYHAVGNIKLR